MPAISVVIPVLNGEKYIETTLESLFQQTFHDWELIVIDDGSTDGTAMILDQIAKGHEEIKVIHQKNAGLGAARNRGVEEATADWVCFLDADDLWVPQKLARINHIIKTVNHEWGYHSMFNFLPNGRLRNRRSFAVRNVHQILEKGDPISPSSVWIRKKTFFEFGGFDEDRGGVEDIGLWLRLLRFQHIPIYLEERLGLYRIDVGVSRSVENHLQKVIFVLRKAYEKREISQEDLDIAYSRKNYEAACQARRQGLFEESLHYFGKTSQTGFKVALQYLLTQLRISSF